ncbi:hypothetical protein L6452_21289 [Arctium lappa]|uniref:Uncharacterized protein n=1 Tax=Arctium lappa TaxID=4217 RepID=A0ACB9BE74_ARCLA|nr:hypothetical protein L6452_21289 [Arctium lappa]
MAEEQLDYGDEEFGGSQKMQYHGDGAIPALADDEIGGEDDEYDDLYNDVNVGEGFLQMQRSEALPSANVGNGGFHDQKVNVPEARPEAMPSQDINIPGVAAEGVYQNTGLRLPDNKEGMTVDLLQKRMVPPVTNDVQAVSMGFRGSIPVPQKPSVDPISMSATITNEPAPMLTSNAGHGISGVPQMPGNQMGANANVNMTRPVVNENQIRPPAENGATTLFVGELHWWTTDAELENVLSQYGRVKEIKFFDERASGKSKGYCQVEFYESGSAAACKEGMNGYVFNGRPCVVAFASPQTIRQMGASYANKNQGTAQSQPEPQGRRPMNDGAGRGGGTNFAGGDAGRNYGRGNWGRGGQGVLNRGGGHMRGRGAMGPKNVNAPGFGSGPAGGAYGQGLGGPAFGGPPGGFMHPQGMMGGGFDPTYMGRGAGYGGFPGSGFPGMMPQFPGVNTMGLAGVAPHVNPAFFGRGMGAGGMGMMGTSGMEGPQAGMWGDTSMGGWGGEEHGQRTRESSYGGEDGASEYGYGEASHDKGARSNAVSREKERGSEREWSGNSEKRHRDDRDQDRERHDKDYKYKEEKDSYREHRQKERNTGYEDDWDRGQSSTRSRSRSRAMPEEDHRSRSRDADYGKRRRMRSD